MINKFLTSLSYLSYQSLTIANFFFNIYILFVLSFFGNTELTADCFILISIITLLTHGFSFNSRNILIANKKIVFFNRILKFRITVGILSFIATLLIIKNFFNENNFFIYVSIVLITIFAWIIEIILAKKEIEKKFDIFYFFTLFLFILLTPFIIKFTLNNLIYFIIIYCLTCYLAFFNYFRINFKEIKKIFLDNLKKFKLGLSSSFFKYFSNIVWRYSTVLLIGDQKSGILFLGFSFGSFMGTLFDVSYGASLVNKIKKININKFILYIILYILFLTIIIYAFKNFSNLSDYDKFFFEKVAKISILGGLLMLFTLAIRQSLFKIKKFHSKCYKIDLLGYIFIMILVPIIYVINANYLIFAFLISSVFTFVIYVASYKILIK